MRHLNYLQYLLKCEENSMLSKFFKTKLSFPVKDNWTEQTKQDMIDFNITENLDWIKTTSVYKFRKLVKKSKGKPFKIRMFGI